MAEVKVSALTALTGANVANGDELYIVDTGSPNVSKKITADELAQMPQLSSRYKPLASDTIWVPAKEFTASNGNPVMAEAANRVAVMAFDATGFEIAVASAYIPQGWATVHLDLWWTNLGAGSGDVNWLSARQQLSDGNPIPTLSSWNAAVVVAAPVQDTIKVTRFTSSAVGVTSGRVLSFYVYRQGGDATDTLGNDAGLVGAALVRAS